MIHCPLHATISQRSPPPAARASRILHPRTGTLNAFDHAADQCILVQARPLVVLAPVKYPLHDGNDQDDAKRHDAVVHVCRVRRVLGWEDEEHRRQNRPQDADHVENPAQRALELERPVLGEHAPATQTVDEGRDGIGHAQGHDRRRDDGAEGTLGAEEDAAEDYNPASRPNEGVEGHVERGVHLGEDAAEGKTAVARKGVTHAAARRHERRRGEEHAHGGEDE